MTEVVKKIDPVTRLVVTEKGLLKRRDVYALQRWGWLGWRTVAYDYMSGHRYSSYEYIIRCLERFEKKSKKIKINKSTT